MKKIKSIGSSFAIAFSMYSKIPMPQAEWSEENRKYVICFFPLVGAVAGALCYAWYRLCGGINAGAFFYTAGMAAIPLFLTGGIHVDGFMDTMDALHSYRDREEKLRILKDSHIGAFAVICLLGYYLTYLGGISELKSDRAVLCFCLGFLLSRTLSGLGYDCSLPPVRPGCRRGIPDLETGSVLPCQPQFGADGVGMRRRAGRGAGRRCGLFWENR